MDKLRTLKTFICVAQQASFAEAARQLDMSAASVSRAVAALEAQLGVQRLRRTTRSVRLTQEGVDFLARCQAGITEIESAYEIARSGQSGPRGTMTRAARVSFHEGYIDTAPAGAL
ncbi:LysR family transcriptional regulator [Alcanivorax quisquiliarum]|uniref:LysR family transcriptional regulator n=1 Tax=Alcanivorax quisquiliarum TaxID=2933565 RepID=A0ABT0E9A1_9GAMM|nr:LysR family transcriptional regulator [Alcanivorax quisquiliarum]MCK0538417.1 LysR family transcriptional regulator [Alcanivorax quisquiliarum]